MKYIDMSVFRPPIIYNVFLNYNTSRPRLCRGHTELEAESNPFSVVQVNFLASQWVR